MCQTVNSQVCRYRVRSAGCELSIFREALNKSDFVVALRLAHKKYLLTYHPYAASIFFARALSHLELELIQSFLSNFYNRQVKMTRRS
jgi:hypothetical protein